MDPRLEERLVAIERMVAENNHMLRKMRNAQRSARVFKFLYWLVIIGLTIAALYFVKPYITMMGDAYGINTDKETSGMDVTSLLESYKALQGE